MGDEHKASRPTAQQASHNDLARAIAAAVGAGGTVEAALDIVRTATTRYGTAPIMLDVSVPAPAPLNKPPGTLLLGLRCVMPPQGVTHEKRRPWGGAGLNHVHVARVNACRVDPSGPQTAGHAVIPAQGGFPRHMASW